MNRLRSSDPGALAGERDPAREAASVLVGRHGRAAAGILRERVERLERAAEWKEHAAALQVLTAVERILSGEP